MKRFVPYAAALLGAVLLASCYMMTVRPTGSISLNLGGPSSRAIDPAAHVRVYLYTYTSPTNYGLYTFPGGKQYAEFVYGSGTQTLSGIPVGLWKVLVSVGKNGPSGTDAFYTDAYGASPIIGVTQGSSSSTTITTKPSPFAYSAALAGQNLKSIAYDYSYSVLSDYPGLFTATAADLYAIIPSQSAGTIDLSVDQPFGITGLPAGIKINSLSEAFWENITGMPTMCIYINSNQGIIPYSYYTGGMDTSYSMTLTDSDGGRLDILDAVAVSDSGGDIVVYYRRARDVGGVFLTPNSSHPYDGTSGTPWVKDPGFSSSTNNASVLDVAVDSVYSPNGYAYYAATSGAFRASPSLVTYPNSSLTGNVVYFSAPNKELIQAIAVDSEENVIYIGTPKGGYYAQLDEGSPSDVKYGSWIPIQETMGDSIVSIVLDKSASYSASGAQAVALRSRYNIYTLPGPVNLGGTVTTYPFYAGLPGELNAMDFAKGILFLAGSWGLASVPVGNIQLAY